METITIPKEEYLRLKNEVKTLRNTKLYRRILDFEKNISTKKYTREDLGF